MYLKWREERKRRIYQKGSSLAACSQGRCPYLAYLERQPDRVWDKSRDYCAFCPNDAERFYMREEDGELVYKSEIEESGLTLDSHPVLARLLGLHGRVKLTPHRAAELEHWEQEGIEAVGAGISIYEEDILGRDRVKQEKEAAKQRLEAQRMKAKAVR